MEHSILMEKYPVFDMILQKGETYCGSVDEIIAKLKTHVDADTRVCFISIFDHYSHTKSTTGEIAPEISDAKNIIFCFGLKLPNPRVLAVRPRSIGVVDMGDHFHISFMEPPMPIATEAIQSWCKSLADKAA